MTDFDDELERRLRADAARHDAADVEPPSLTDALAAATARPRVPLTWLAVAATVLLVAGVAIAIGLHGTGRGGQRSAGSLGTDPPPPPPSGVATERGDKRLFYFDDAGFDGVVLDPDDPRVLGVVVPYSTKKDECSLFGAAVRIVAQSADDVVLKASGFQYVDAGTAHRKYSGFSCAENGVAVVRVRLDAPLGHRSIEPYRAPSVALGPGPELTVPADPRDLPSPSYLPAGYALARTTPASFRTGRLVGERVYGGVGAKLVLQVGPGSALDPTSKDVVGHARVRGQVTAVTVQPHESCITWSESFAPTARTRQICSYADPALSNTELLRIARSVH